MSKLRLVLRGIMLVFFALVAAHSSSGPPVAYADYPPAASLAAGASHTCAVTQSGGLKCWGYAAFGQLGNGGNPTNPPSHTPVDVMSLTSGIATVAASATDHTTCVVTTGGGVKCWGENTGNFGGSVYTPVDVVGLESGVQAVDVGEGHRCALTAGGGVKCWGTNNGSGQLGNGTEISTMLPGGAQGPPVDPIGLTSGVTAISIGHRHSCALTTAGGVKCWGINFNGEVGDGTTTDRLSPVDVTGLSSGVAAISAGTSHTCALMSTGGVKCWGAGGSGRLGDGTVTRRLSPVDVVGLPGPVASISAGQSHTCAVMADGTARCWGDNSFGKAGDGSGISQRLTPVAVVGISSVQSIVAGGGHTCATLTSGGVRCWGRNEFGQLGIGQGVEYSSPAPVLGLANGYGSVRAGGFHSCAVTAIGGLRCWGKNDNGQLGDGTTTDRFSPVHVAGLTHGVAAVTTGEIHSCALLTTGGLKCWGNNGQGRLGDGTALERLTPVDVTGLTSGVLAVSAGTAHTCALTAAGGVKCWGLNTLGRLGDGTTASRTTPVDVVGLTSGVVAVAAGDIHTCALLASGAMRCWGSNLNGAWAMVPPPTAVSL